ncbi:hypothetical protein [Ruegeria sp. A3M17]|uniref:hypothetical protein n=1 Tax=Ruegeria sp. A3M17 TaxID=2267229 RepID=UPI0011BEADB4|nr:hypothetical protein [Ruegeria sp. A3M17]
MKIVVSGYSINSSSSCRSVYACRTSVGGRNVIPNPSITAFFGRPKSLNALAQEKSAIVRRS